MWSSSGCWFGSETHAPHPNSARSEPLPLAIERAEELLALRQGHVVHVALDNQQRREAYFTPSKDVTPQMGSFGKLHSCAFEEAERLGHAELDPEHLVLAMLRAEADSPAGQALNACGLSYESFRRELEELPQNYLKRSSPVPEPGFLWVSVSGMTLCARAEGIALGLGHRRVRTEDVLLAVIWEEPSSMVSHILDRLGATRERIRGELEALDVDMPRLPFRRRREWEEWRPVSKEELDRLGAELRSAELLYRVGYKDTQPMISIEKKHLPS